MSRWKCSACGNITEGDAPSRFCGMCGASSDSIVLLEEPEDANPSGFEAPEEQTQYDVWEDVSDAPAAAASWQSWTELPAGHGQGFTAIRALFEHTKAFKKDLTDVRDEWEETKAASQKTYDSVTSAAHQQFESDKGMFIKERDNSVKTTENRRNRVSTIVNGCGNFLNNLPRGEADSAIAAGNAAMQAVAGQRGRVDAAITAKINAYRTLCECKISDAERIRNDKLDRARKEQIARDTAADRKFKSQNKTACEKGNRDIEAGFNRSSIRAYCQEIRSSRFHAETYECPKEVPDYIMLGSIGLSIPNESQDDMSVVQAVELQTGEVGSKSGSEYVVRIPYAQRLADGVSLLMRYSPAERSFVQKQIQPLLLKLFLSFPAGKLEATMIDPLELGASFPDIPKLAEGANSGRIIDTKIWSKERDIETAIATLRQRLENMTQAYGNDHLSRLKKEVVRVLAITDFPAGFNDTALKDLHAIVRNSASLGVCVLICANDQELDKLRKNNSSLLTEIMNSVVETKASGNRLMLPGNDQRIFLELDDMSDVMSRKTEILSMISNEIEHMQLKVEHFHSMFRDDIYDSNNWFTGSHDEIAIPLGIKGANTIVKMILGRGRGSTEHHALIAGQTGAGKSTLLHTLIMSTLISYSPEEVQMYLLDFKEGVEFSAYTRYRLPSLRVVAINSEREFGLAVLKELCSELEDRSKHFTRYGASDINSYCELEDVPKVPKLLLIFDEVQELFRPREESDSISSDCLSCLNRLVMQGRAMGIHVILACQDFRNCSGLEAYFSQMAIRIAVKGSEEGAASILNSDNAGIRTLQNQPAGAAIYNGGGGVESANNFFQVSYINEKERMELLERLDAYFTDPQVAPLYENMQTRILLTNAEDNIHNCFNRLILEGRDSVEPLGTSEDGYGMLLGQGFGKKSIFIPEIRRKDRANLLVVSKDEKIALSLFELSAMSVLYEELHTSADKANALVYVVDLFADELSDDECDFDYLESRFPMQIKIAKMGDAEGLIQSLYETVIGRSEGRLADTERIFLLFFGIDRARNLQTSSLYDEDRDGALLPMEMLQKILRHGPKHGVNSIVWSESLRGVEHMLGDRYGALFDQRIAYDLDEDSMYQLVSENGGKSKHGKTAAYIDIGKDVKNTHFRPYDIPAKIWIERYAEAYDEAIGEGGY